MDISTLKQALLRGNQNPAHIASLGLAYYQKYEQADQREDLDIAILCYQTSLRGGLVSHGLLNNLAIGLYARFNQLKTMQDLEEAITYHEKALKLCPPRHPHRSVSLNNLGLALYAKYNQLGEKKDLIQAINCNEQALKLRPPGHPDRSMSLDNLADVLVTRYSQLGEMKDLGEAITCYEQALKLCLPGHPDRTILSKLASASSTRYEQLGEIKDLEQNISCYEQVLVLCPPGHTLRASSLNNLGGALLNRYNQLGKIKDLEQAITCEEQSLGLRPPGHPDRSGSLNNLAMALSARYDQLGDVNDLQQTIMWNEEALALCPPGHPDRYMSLNNLASTLFTRYEYLGKMEDLEKAITCHEQALKLCPSGHQDRSTSLNNLAISLSTRYHQFGEIKDLEQAINFNEEALKLRPPGHSLRSGSLNNLASALSARYDHLGEINDLEQVIICNKQALKLCPPGHPDRSMSLNNLASACSARYKQFRDIGDLGMAIICYEQALKLCLPGHPLRSGSLNNLAVSLFTKYKELGDMKDLEEAITVTKQALSSYSPSHPSRSGSLHNLTGYLSRRYEQLGDMKDLESATASYKAALACLTAHHPSICSIWSTYALMTISVHESTWMPCHNCSHLDEACSLSKSAVYHATSSLYDRFRAAKNWARAAHRHKHSSAIAAYSIALDLQQQYLALLPSIVSQQSQMEKSSNLGLNAASCAISAGNLEAAVQFLEQGRSILWSKIQGYRHSLEKLSEKDPKLANEFRRIGYQLEHNSVSSDADIAHQRVLSEQWAALLKTIRQLDGLSDFLQAVPFTTLQNVAAEGPVIMINVSDFQSDAIILVSSAPPIAISLPDASPNKLKQFVDQLSEITTGAKPSKDVLTVLQGLWDAVVQPIVNQLAQLRVPGKSRIWWCPTSYLCGLPIHAAGPYTKGSKNLPYLYVSSYTPTLTSLMKARSRIVEPQASPNILLVSQPDNTIPKVAEEIEVVKSLRKDIYSCSGQDAHKEAVLLGLQSHSWVHFACHGHLEYQPFDSWFQLYNGEHLTVLDLVKADIPDAEFAFLSACHSAAGDIYGTPDESIHLAAALQFCGFKSVIGTLWAMVDDDGPALAQAFYSHLFRNGDNANVKDAAESLNFATKELKKQHVTLDRRINFIHIGA